MCLNSSFPQTCYSFPNPICCNAYQRDPGSGRLNCVTQCPTNFSASPATNFTCGMFILLYYETLCIINNYVFFSKHAECDLGCRNGGRNNADCNMCICPDGITGDFCETLPNPCDPNPCRNNGTCSAISSTEYTCTCPPGFTGANCTIELNPCDPNPCRNNGTCMRAGAYPNITCTCPPGFTGVNCTIELNPCDPNPCRNNGTCMRAGAYPNITCTCPPGFTGVNCTIELNPCDPNPCRNNGTCMRAGAYPNITCTCPPGFTGVNCTIELNPCDPNPCRNNGTCMRAGAYPNITCTCPPRYTGSLCETDICSRINCLNGGTCVVENGVPVCTCPSNFNGSMCENCTIPNCRRCSPSVPGLCLECLSGFKLEANGRCCEFLFPFNLFLF